MGRGTSKAAGGGGGAMALTVETQDGSKVDLTDNPLIYGGDDKAVSGALRKVLEEQETKRLKAKTEYGILTDDDGNLIGDEKHGGKGSVRFSVFDVEKATVLTHNHPRGKGEEGELGGTFSEADLSLFSKRPNLKTIRASAAEGTYSMTKSKGFDKIGFNAYVKQINQKHDAAMRKVNKEWVDEQVKKIANKELSFNDYLQKQKAFHSKIFNSFLVNVHNDLIAGQKQFGYTYTLERR